MLTLGRRCDVLAGKDGNSKSFLDDNYTVGKSKNVKAVMRNQRVEGSSIGMIFNIKEEKSDRFLRKRGCFEIILC